MIPDVIEVPVCLGIQVATGDVEEAKKKALLLAQDILLNYPSKGDTEIFYAGLVPNGEWELKAYIAKDKTGQLRKVDYKLLQPCRGDYYMPSCKYWHNDCINDPAYIKVLRLKQTQDFCETCKKSCNYEEED